MSRSFAVEFHTIVMVRKVTYVGDGNGMGIHHSPWQTESSYQFIRASSEAYVPTIKKSVLEAMMSASETIEGVI